MKFPRSCLCVLAALSVFANPARAADAPVNPATAIAATIPPTAAADADVVPPIDLLPPSGPPELVPVGGNVTPAEIADLQQAVQTYQKGADPEDFTPLENFLQQYPQSAYRASVLVNLGELAFHYGYYSKALDYDEKAWSLAKTLDLPKDPTAQKVISGAGIRLAGLYADLGRRKELEALSIALEPYPKWGADVPLYESGIQSAVIMHNKPTTSYNCGPYALLNIAKARPDFKANEKLFTDAKATPEQGFTVAEVEKLAQDAGLHYVAARRVGDAALPLPVVAHWKAGHYAAVLEEKDGRYHVKDPTFGTDFWMSAKALKDESSGVFIVPAGQDGGLPTGWQAASNDDRRLIGRGVGEPFNNKNTTPNECPCASTPMAAVSYNLFSAFAYVTDTPIQLPAPYGPSIAFQLSYYAGENGGQVPTATATVGNTSLASWTMNYLSSVLQPSTSNSTVTLLSSDGTEQTYNFVTAYNATTGNYSENLSIITGAVMEQESSGGNVTGYVQHFADGSTTTFSKKVPVTGVGNYYLLTSMADPQGNAVTLSYSGNLLSYVTDASGQYCNLTYYNGTNYIKSISDEYGRTANLTYDGSYKLTSITDPVGIVSNFTYTNSTITTVGTPYGNTSITATTTTLSGVVGSEGNQTPFMRTVLIEDPASNQQRVTFGNPIYSNSSGSFLDVDATSLYFSKHAMAEISADLSGTSYSTSGNAWLGLGAPGYAAAFYQLASQITWNTSGSVMQAVPDEVIEPVDLSTMEGWESSKDTQYYYLSDSNGLPISSEPDEVYEINPGNGSIISSSYYSYNVLGKVTQFTDPADRVTSFNYYPNNVDLQNIQQYGASGYETQVAYGPYTNHLPANITDAALAVTSLSYNSSVGLLPQTVQLMGTGNTAIETITYNHNANGTVANVTLAGGNLSATLDSYTYANDTVQTHTDARGFTANYTYDPIQRMTGATYSDGTSETWNYTGANISNTTKTDSLSLNYYIDRQGRTANFTYDGDNHVLTTKDAAGRTTKYDWCGCGALNSITDANNNVTSFTYDFAGDVLTKNITVTGAVNPTETYSSHYNYALGWMTQTLPSTFTRTTTYNPDRTINSIYTSDFGNDGSGIADVGPPDLSFTYDPHYPRVASMNDGGWANYTYGNVGSVGALKVTQVTSSSAPNATVSYSYDALGRLTSRNVMSDDLGTTLQSETYAYNGLGQLQTVGGDMGNTTLSYNTTTMQLTGLAYPNGMNTTFGYGNVAQGAWLASITNNASTGGNTAIISQGNYTRLGDGTISTWQQSYGWNPAVAAQASNTTPVQQQLMAFTYDGSGWLTEAKFGQPNGNVTSPGVAAVWEDYTFGYDGAGNRLTGNVSGLANPTNLSGLAANLDTTSTLTGNFNTDNSLNYLTRSGRVEVSGVVSKPSVVTVNELPTRQWSLPGGVQWGFDASLPLTLGNGTTTNVTVRATDALNNETTHTWEVSTDARAATFTYSVNGDDWRKEIEPNTSMDTIIPYTWTTNGLLNTAPDAAFAYDGFNRRVSLAGQTWNGTAWVAANVEYYVWDGDQIVQKRVSGNDSANITERFYSYGYQTLSSGTVTGNYFYTKDHLGSIREVVGSDGQTVEGRYSYGPWGETTYLDNSGGSVPQPNFGYAGYFTSPYVPGLYLTKYRAYDPSLGRWLSRDPIGEAGGLNLYGYANNDPVNRRDPLGLQDGDPFPNMDFPNPNDFDSSGTPVGRSADDQLADVLFSKLGHGALTAYEGMFGLLFSTTGVGEGVGAVCEASTTLNFIKSLPPIFTGIYGVVSSGAKLTGNDLPPEVSIPGDAASTTFDVAGVFKGEPYSVPSFLLDVIGVAYK